MLGAHRNLRISRLLALGALFALLGCSTLSNNPDRSDTILEVVSVTPVSSDPTATTVDDTTTIVVKAVPRNPAATTVFNDVNLTTYRVEYSALLAPISGIITTGFVPAGGTATLNLVVVSGAAKMGAFAGSTITARITIKGKDLSDHDVSFVAVTAITFTTT
jgi:hypothetical protein